MWIKAGRGDGQLFEKSPNSLQKSTQPDFDAHGGNKMDIFWEHILVASPVEPFLFIAVSFVKTLATFANFSWKSIAFPTESCWQLTPQT